MKINKQIYEVYTFLERHCPIEISSVTEMFYSYVACYMWLLNACNKPSMTEELNFPSNCILTNLNLNLTT